MQSEPHLPESSTTHATTERQNEPGQEFFQKPPMGGPRVALPTFAARWLSLRSCDEAPVGYGPGRGHFCRLFQAHIKDRLDEQGKFQNRDQRFQPATAYVLNRVMKKVEFLQSCASDHGSRAMSSNRRGQEVPGFLTARVDRRCD
jgi:hypothetical protein